MSTTGFNDVFRTALWNTYKHRCFYCNQPLDWDELQIDHLVPEWMQEDTKKLAALVIDLGLKADFKVNEAYNLVPAHSKCNLKKSGYVFESSAILFYLQLSKSKNRTLNAEIDRLNSRKNKGVILSKLQSALATNLIDLDEMSTLIEKAKQDEWSAKSIDLPHDIEFIDGVFKSFYLNENYSWLYDKILPETGLVLTNDHSELKYPHTVRDWIEATKDGFYPNTNADIKMSSGFLFLEEFLKILEFAKMPKMSFISDPWLTLKDLDSLSPSLLVDPEKGLKEYIYKGLSIGDLVRMDIIKINSSDRYEFSLEYNWMETSMREQFRADFNDDGIEDIFVQGWCRAIGGTLGFAFTSVLTKYSKHHLIEQDLQHKPKEKTL